MYKENSEAKTILHQKFINDTKFLDRKANDEKKKIDDQKKATMMQNFEWTAGMSTELLETVLTANKRNANEEKNIARTMAGVNTAVGITRAIMSGALWQIPIIAALGIAQQIKISNSRYAMGTKSSREGPALLGENGPEIAYLPRGTEVKTSYETKQILGGNTFNLILPSGMPVDNIAADRIEKMLPMMLENLADNLQLNTFKSKLGAL